MRASPVNLVLGCVSLADLLFVGLHLGGAAVYASYPHHDHSFPLTRALQPAVVHALALTAHLAALLLEATVTAMRCVAVAWPLRARSLCTMNKAKIAVVTSVFIASFGYNIPYFLFLSYNTIKNKTKTKYFIKYIHHITVRAHCPSVSARRLGCWWRHEGWWRMLGRNF